MAIEVGSAAREVTLGSDRYTWTVELLEQWGAERRRITKLLRLPVLSSMSVMVDYLRREEDPEKVVRSDAPTRRERQERRRKVKKYRARVCRNNRCRKIYTGPSCQQCGTPPLELTARGTATRAATDDRRFGFTSAIAQIDGIIEKLPGRYRAALYRGYAYEQPDRVAARELNMARESFTWLREAGVILVAERLAQRMDSCP